MTTRQKRISIPIGADELEALRLAARRDFRDTRDQARYLLRVTLGLDKNGDTLPTKDSTAGFVLADTGGAVDTNQSDIPNLNADAGNIDDQRRTSNRKGNYHVTTQDPSSAIPKTNSGQE